MTPTPMGTSLSIAGSINQSGTAVMGKMHLDGSSCFDRLTTISLSGTLIGSSLSLTSTLVGGQVAAFTGSISDTTFTGTYTIQGGCADGNQGTVTATKIPLMASALDGTFTPARQTPFNLAAQLTQAPAGSDGTFALTGSVSISTPCFSSGAIKSGKFPSGSFILGTWVGLQIETNNGTVAFLGTLDQTTGEISGDYTVSGGSCDDSGTATLSDSAPWDY